MALDDFVTEKEHEIGSIKSRKKVKNVTLNEDQWQTLITHNAGIIKLLVSEWETNEIKAVVSTMDDILDDEIETIIPDSDQSENIENVRDDIISEHLEE